MSEKERATLRAMAGEEKSKLNEISRRLQEGTNVVSKYLEYLIIKGMVAVPIFFVNLSSPRLLGLLIVFLN